MSTTLNPAQQFRAALVLADTGRSFRKLPDGSIHWRDGKAAPTDAEMEAAYRRSIVPVRNAALRLALIDAGIAIATVDAAIAAITDATTREKIAALWDHENPIHRDDARVVSMATALGITSAQADAIFIAAEML